MVNKNQRVLVVVDVSNLFYCIKKKFANLRLNYESFLNEVVQGRELYRAIAYGAEIDNEAAGFKAALRHFGYEPKYKAPKIYYVGDKEQRKADWDVGMAMDVVAMLDSVDVVIFATADGDMTPCLEYVKSRGKIAEVYACDISRELKTAANKWFEIGESLLEEPKANREDN